MTIHYHYDHDAGDLFPVMQGSRIPEQIRDVLPKEAESRKQTHALKYPDTPLFHTHRRVVHRIALSDALRRKR